MFRVFSQRDGRGHLKSFHSTADANLFFSPASISGLNLWLSANSLQLADGAAIAAWGDQSVNAYTVTAASGSQPTFKIAIQNSQPVVRFNGTSSWFSTNAPSPLRASGFNLFAVFKVTSASIVSTFVGSTVQSGLQYRLASGKQDLVAEASADLGLGVATWDASAFRLYEATMDTSGNCAYFVNGAADGTFSTSTSLAAGSVTVGKNASPTSGSGEFMSGDLGELLIYNRALTAAERQQLETSLRGKWGI